MPSEIRKVAVIGSGVMGSQLAAQIANAGVPVLLLDIVPKDASDRNVLAKKAIERMMGAASPFTHPDAAKMVEACNIDDDLGRIKECDLVLESVLENPRIKNDLFKKIDALRKPETVIASNTTTLSLSNLIADQSPSFAKDCVITHFFDPVRHMRPVELVIGPKTDPVSIQTMTAFCDKVLGKGVVPCNDTPGFVANRLGMFWLQSAVNAAFDLGLSVEEADEVCRRAFGIPSTGIFGLVDLIGIDLMPVIGRNLTSTLPTSDTYRRIFQVPDLFHKMIEGGYTGRKGKGGFYRFVQDASGAEVKESINLETGEYALCEAPKISILERAGSDLRILCEAPDRIGQFAWRVLSETLLYAFHLVPATVSSIVYVDDAMKMGYNWKFGPFELMDKLGVDWTIRRLKAEARPVPDLLSKASGKGFYRTANGYVEYLKLNAEFERLERPDGVLLLKDIKLSTKPVHINASACLWDIGDGVLCLEFTSKANVLDHDVFDMILKGVETIGGGQGRWKGLVISHEGKNFSLGLDLNFIGRNIRSGDYEEIEDLVKKAQKAYSALRFAPFPSVAAPAAKALGSGAELMLHCSAIQACCEVTVGLVGLHVGLIPACGGCAQMLGRAYAKTDSDMPPVNEVFALLFKPQTTSSAADAKIKGYLRATDGVTMNRDRLLFDAKAKVLQMAVGGYQAPKPYEYYLPGPSGKAALELELQASQASPHDIAVGKELANVLCGDESGLSGALTEQQVMDAECSAFLNLCRIPETLARIENMLDQRVPLRNELLSRKRA